MKIKMYLETGFVGATHEDEMTVPDDEWNSMTPTERDQYMEESLQTMVSNYCETWYEAVEDDE